MDSKERQLLINKILSNMEQALSCTSEQAGVILAAAEGFKFNGTSTTDAVSYLTQLLWKLQLSPTEKAVSHVSDYLQVHSIVTDVPEEARKLLLNPSFPFLAGLTYKSSAASMQPELESFTKSKMHDRMATIPKKVPNFFYIEQFMPEKFYTVMANGLLEGALSKGLALVTAAKPVHLWMTKTEAAHAFTTGMDEGASGVVQNKLDTGTLVAINSNFLHRLPDVFAPLHKHTKIVCMQYKKPIEARALSVEKY